FRRNTTILGIGIGEELSIWRNSQHTSGLVSQDIADILRGAAHDWHFPDPLGLLAIGEENEVPISGAHRSPQISTHESAGICPVAVDSNERHRVRFKGGENHGMPAGGWGTRVPHVAEASALAAIGMHHPECAIFTQRQ